MSELLRQAIRLFMEEREWRRSARYREIRDSGQGIGPG